MMDEINVVGIGSSFDLNNLKNLKGPIFHVPSWGPLRIDNNGKIFNRHDFLYKEFRWNDIEESLDDGINKEYKPLLVCPFALRLAILESSNSFLKLSVSPITTPIP